MENNIQVVEPKKSKKGKIIAIVVVVVLVLAGLGLWYSGTVFGISQDEAKDIALNQIDAAGNADNVLVHEEFDDMQKVYNVQFTCENMIYDFEIAARNGNIINQESEMIAVSPQQDQNQNSQNGQNGNAQNGQSGQSNQQGTEIGLEKAKEIALQKVSGASESDIVKAALDNEDGVMVYEIEIHYNSMEYDFSINAATGVIVEQSSESIYD